MFISAALVFAAITVAAVNGEAVHYPPASTNINNLTYVFNGSGSPGIFDSSKTPNSKYGTYNWCNMPHVRQREYKTPPKDYTLQYVEVIQRHHKRTPYGSNTFFKEDVQWSCDGAGAVFGSTSPGTKSSPVQWQAYRDPQNPWTSIAAPGFVGSTCQFPQITSEGLEDSITHGSDLRTVYASRLGLGPKFDPKTAKIRVTNNVITSQVASGLLVGLFPQSKSDYNAALIQSSSFDSLEPTYSCRAASNLRADYTTGASGEQWKLHLSQAADLYAKLDKISGIAPDDSGWHASFDHYYDNLSAKQCHGKSLPCNLNDASLCVTQEVADTVYRLGSWEYSYQFRDAPASAKYAALRYGAWVLELKGHLQDKVDGKSKVKYIHNVAHDGSMSPLLGFLQVDQMVWPGMGSEVVFELYNSKNKEYFIRVLWGGQPMKTSTPLGTLDMVPLSDFFAYIDSMVGSANDLYTACNQ